jgi:hypothetical protein
MCTEYFRGLVQGIGPKIMITLNKEKYHESISTFRHQRFKQSTSRI